MHKLRFFNAFGIAVILKNSVVVTMFAFPEDGMYKVTKKYSISPDLPIKDPKGHQVPFACTIHEESDPEFTFSFVKNPENAQAILDNSRLLDFLFDAAEQLSTQLGKTKQEHTLPLAH